MTCEGFQRKDYHDGWLATKDAINHLDNLGRHELNVPEACNQARKDTQAKTSAGINNDLGRCLATMMSSTQAWTIELNLIAQNKCFLAIIILSVVRSQTAQMNELVPSLSLVSYPTGLTDFSCLGKWLFSCSDATCQSTSCKDVHLYGYCQSDVRDTALVQY